MKIQYVRHAFIQPLTAKVYPGMVLRVSNTKFSGSVPVHCQVTPGMLYQGGSRANYNDFYYDDPIRYRRIDSLERWEAETAWVESRAASRADRDIVEEIIGIRKLIRKSPRSSWSCFESAVGPILRPYKDKDERLELFPGRVYNISPTDDGVTFEFYVGYNSVLEELLARNPYAHFDVYVRDARPQEPGSKDSERKWEPAVVDLKVTDTRPGWPGDFTGRLSGLSQNRLYEVAVFCWEGWRPRQAHVWFSFVTGTRAPNLADTRFERIGIGNRSKDTYVIHNGPHSNDDTVSAFQFGYMSAPEPDTYDSRYPRSEGGGYYAYRQRLNYYPGKMITLPKTTKKFKYEPPGLPWPSEITYRPQMHAVGPGGFCKVYHGSRPANEETKETANE